MNRYKIAGVVFSFCGLLCALTGIGWIPILAREIPILAGLEGIPIAMICVVIGNMFASFK